jgi:hypothetical protein
MQKSALNRYFNIFTIFTTFKKPICDSMQCLGSGSGPTQIQIRNKKKPAGAKKWLPLPESVGGGRGGAGPFPLFPKFNLVENDRSRWTLLPPVNTPH